MAMVQAIILGAACLGIYGVFLSVRGMIRLWKLEQKQMLVCMAAFFLLAPLLVVGGLFLGDNGWTLWLALPVLALAIAWICQGYFLEFYLRRELRLKQDGLKRVIPKRPAKGLRNDLLLLAAALLIWCWGMFIGIKTPMVETCAICLCVFLLARSLASLWRYRGF